MTQSAFTTGWIVVRNFFGATVLSLAAGLAIAAVCLATGLVLRALLEAARWGARLL